MFDFNRFSKHNIIGELRLQLCDVDWNHVIEEWKDLVAPAKFEVRAAAAVQRGVETKNYKNITPTLWFLEK